jgi:hypothetical protein
MTKEDHDMVAQLKSYEQLHLQVRAYLERGNNRSKSPQCLLYGYSISPHSTNAIVFEPLKTILSIIFG